MDSKKPPKEGATDVSLDDAPPISPDREHLLAKKFEDANLAEVMGQTEEKSEPVVHEAVEAVQELVAEAASGTIDLSQLPADDGTPFVSGSASDGGSMIPESKFETGEENTLDLGDTGGEELEFQLSERLAPGAPKAAAPKPVTKEVPTSVTLPIRPEVKTGQFEVQKGPDSQSFASAEHLNKGPATELGSVDTREMEIQKDICATTEANKEEAENAELFLVENHAADMAQLVSRDELAERMFQLVACELCFDDLVEAGLTAIIKATGAQAGSILEMDIDTLEFFFRASVGGGDPEKLKSFRVPAMKGIVGHVAESRQPMILRDLEDDSRQLRAISMSAGFEAKCCLAAPILVANKLYGVLELFNKQGADYFEERDLKMAEDGLRMLAKALEVRFLMAELFRRVG